MKRQQPGDNVKREPSNHSADGCNPEKPACGARLIKGSSKFVGCLWRLLVTRVEIAPWEMLLGVTIGQLVYVFMRGVFF